MTERIGTSTRRTPGAGTGLDFAVSVETKPGEEISAGFQAALDKVREYGGTVMLPPGTHKMTKGVSSASAGTSRLGAAT